MACKQKALPLYLIECVIKKMGLSLVKSDGNFFSALVALPNDLLFSKLLVHLESFMKSLIHGEKDAISEVKDAINDKFRGHHNEMFGDLTLNKVEELIVDPEFHDLSHHLPSGGQGPHTFFFPKVSGPFFKFRNSVILYLWLLPSASLVVGWISTTSSAHFQRKNRTFEHIKKSFEF